MYSTAITFIMLYILSLAFIYLFMAMLWGLQDLSSPISVPWPGIEPRPPAVEAWSPNHWTTREFPSTYLYNWNFVPFDCLLPMPRAWVRSLVGKLRSHKLHSAVKIKKVKNICHSSIQFILHSQIFEYYLSFILQFSSFFILRYLNIISLPFFPFGTC